MRRALPHWLQTPLTHSGKPYQGEVPRERTSLFHVATATGSAACGVGVSLSAHLLWYGLSGPTGLGADHRRSAEAAVDRRATSVCTRICLAINASIGGLVQAFLSLLTIQSFPAYKRMHIATITRKRLMTRVSNGRFF